MITHADELDATKAASSKKSKYHSGDVSSNTHVPLLTTTVAAAAMDQQAHHNAIALGGATGGSSRMMGSGTASSPLFCGSSQDNDSFSNRSVVNVCNSVHVFLFEEFVRFSYDLFCTLQIFSCSQT